MRLKLCLLAVLWPVLNTIAQPPANNKPDKLTVGDTLPDLVLRDLHNSCESSINMASLKNRLVLIDFWATWCTACIAAFPHLGELKQDLKDSLYIILVTSDNNPVDEAMLARFLNRYKERTGTAIAYPAVLRDTLISNFFDIPSIPHYIWLWNGRILAITSTSAVTPEWIRELIQTSSL